MIIWASLLLLELNYTMLKTKILTNCLSCISLISLFLYQNFTSEFRPRGHSFHYKHLHDEADAAERPLIPTLGSRSKSLSSMVSSYGSTSQNSNSQKLWGTGRGTSDRYPPIS